MNQAGRPGAQEAILSPMEILRQAWSQKLVFIALLALISAVLISTVMAIKDRYSSDALLMVRLNNVDFANVPSVIGGLPSGEGMSLVHSEVEILASEEIARQVVQELDLANVPGFLPEPSFTSKLRGTLFGNGRHADPAIVARDRMAAAVGEYMKDLSVYNDGKSYIIQIGFSGADGALAQRILTVHVAKYLEDQDAAKQAIISRAQHWLDSQLGGLQAQVGASERDLQNYVGANHLNRTSGDTIGTHELGNITTQLATAQSDLARKQAYLDEVNGLSRQSGADISNTTTLGSSTIQRLREQEATKSAEVASLEQQFGNNNPVILNAQGALNGIRAAIHAEMTRMHAAAESDVGLAHANVAALNQSLRQAESQVGGEVNAGVVLAEKQRKLDADRSLYSDLLGRSKQVAIQRQTQEANAYVVSPPTLPLQPSAPRRGLLISLGLCIATVFAGVVAFLVGTLRARSVSLSAVEQKCGINGIGTIPTVRWRRSRSQRAVADIMGPMSKFASSIHTLSNSLSHSPAFPNPQVIAVASALPGDGKTLLTACLGRSFAMSGQRVLLIDGDFRQPDLARVLKVPTSTGILAVLEKQSSLNAAVKRLDELEVDVLPVEKNVGNVFAHLGDDKINALIDQARASYDMILIDTSSMGVVDDSIAWIRTADLTYCVARAGKTPYEAIEQMAKRVQSFGIPCAGIVLNGVGKPRRQTLSRFLPTRAASFNRYFHG